MREWMGREAVAPKQAPKQEENKSRGLLTSVPPGVPHWHMRVSPSESLSRISIVCCPIITGVSNYSHRQLWYSRNMLPRRASWGFLGTLKLLGKGRK